MFAPFSVLVVGSIVLSAEVRLGSAEKSDLTDSLLLPIFNKTAGCGDRGCGKNEILGDNNGYNYHAAQQIFYIYGPLHFRDENSKILPPNMRDDYTVTPEVGIHKLHRRTVKWNQARKICIEEGGHLAIINSLKEERVLINMLDNTVSVAYVGVHDLYEEGDWVTVLDQALETTGYAKWTTFYRGTQPDNYGGNQNCGVLLRAEGMDDVVCSSAHAFFCELPYSTLPN